MGGLIQFSNEEDPRKEKKKNIPAKQYFDLLVFIICILYVVTVTLTKCNQPADWLTFRGGVILIRLFCCLIPVSLHLFLFFVFFLTSEVMEELLRPKKKCDGCT